MGDPLHDGDKLAGMDLGSDEHRAGLTRFVEECGHCRRSNSGKRDNVYSDLRNLVRSTIIGS